MIGKPIRDRRRAKNEKRTKKERKRGKGKLVETAAAEEIVQGAFGSIFLMISSAAWKTLLGFPQLPQARRLHPLQINWRRQSLDSVTFLGEAIRREKVIDAEQRTLEDR
jgi:hypothetical protein